MGKVFHVTEVEDSIKSPTVVQAVVVSSVSWLGLFHSIP